MRRERNYWLEYTYQTEELARFGDAYIEKDLAGRLTVRGGTQEEQTRAMEWLNKWSVGTGRRYVLNR